MLQATNLSVTLGGTIILDRVAFAARPGAMTAIVGPNGSGKTTLLRAMTGDVAHTGTVTLDGRDVATLPPADLAARRGVLPQSARLAFPFTVLEVVRLGLLAGLAGGDEDLPLRALDHVGLRGFAGRFYHELSGGEQHRCQFARVLVQVWEPMRDGAAAWLFLDEPVASLDIGHQLEVMGIARRFADAGGGVVTVMHDLNLTAMFCDSVLLMQDGRSTVQDTPVAVMTDARLSVAYGCSLRVGTTPARADIPFVLPQTASMPMGRGVRTQ